jgi:hypothetical protein
MIEQNNNMCNKLNFKGSQIYIIYFENLKIKYIKK